MTGLARVYLSGLLTAALLGAAGCATGTGEGTVKDSCKLRDCGPTSGGDVDPLDEGVDEDTSLDTGVGPDTGTSPDTGALDTGVADTGATDTGIADTGCKPTDGAACTPLPQCGCGAGLNCDLTSVDGSASCVPAGSKGLHGSPCTPVWSSGTASACAKGFTCVLGACQEFCATATDCSKAGASCLAIEYYDGTTTKSIPGTKACAAPCDPLTPSKVCGASTNCLFADTTHTTCAGAGAGIGASGCSSTNPFSCAPGYLCLSTNECRRWCRIGFAGDCPSGKTCGALTDHPKLSGVEYGVCSA
ncbi:MAG: hypothetical protein IPJ34_36155 [Myxococcales bacterium]|nr:hypothetical protein [Myxococcales bacterium]